MRIFFSFVIFFAISATSGATTDSSCEPMLNGRQEAIERYLKMLERRSLYSEYTQIGLPDPREALFPAEFKESLNGPHRPKISEIPRLRRSIRSLDSNKLLLEMTTPLSVQDQHPIGISQVDFDKMLVDFKDDEELQSIEGFIIFGSRTHFSYGTVPSDESDLDLLALFHLRTDNMSEENDRELIHLLEKRLAGSISGSPIQVAHHPMIARNQFSPHRPMEFYIEQYLNDLSVEKSRKRWDHFFLQRGMELAEKFSKPMYEGNNFRKLLKGAWRYDTDEVFNKEAFFIFRKSERTEKLAIELRARNYLNVILL